MISIDKIINIVETLGPKIIQNIPNEYQNKLQESIKLHTDIATKDLKSFKRTWLEEHWTTLLIGMLFLIIAINYLIAPIINFFIPVRFFQLPDQLWTLIEIVVPTKLGLRAFDKYAPAAIEKMGNKSKEE